MYGQVYKKSYNNVRVLPAICQKLQAEFTCPNIDMCGLTNTHVSMAVCQLQSQGHFEVISNVFQHKIHQGATVKDIAI